MVKQKYLRKENVLFCLIAFNFIFSAFSYTFYYVFNLGYPLVGFMISPIGRLDDFYNSLYYSGENLTFTKAKFTLYPLSVLIYKFFSFQNVHLAAIIFFSLNIILFVYALNKLTKNFLLIILVVSSYPFIFTLARGNNEILLVSLAILCYENLSHRQFKNAFIKIIMQFLIEPYPTYAFQFIPFLQKIKKQIIYTVGISLFVLLGMQFNANTKLYLKELIFEGAAYSSSLGPGTTLHTSSLSGTLQFVYYAINDTFPYESSIFSTFTRILFIVGMISVLSFIYTHRTNIDLITSSLLIVSSYNLFFAITYDYRLLHFVIPLGLFFLNRITKIDALICSSIVILFIPKPFLLFTSPNNSIGETLGSVVNPLIIIYIIVLTLIRFFRLKQPHKELIKACNHF